MKNPQVLRVVEIQNRWTPKLMAMRGVVGTATTRTDDGRLAVMVLSSALAPRCPRRSTAAGASRKSRA